MTTEPDDLPVCPDVDSAELAALRADDLVPGRDRDDHRDLFDRLDQINTSDSRLLDLDLSKLSSEEFDAVFAYVLPLAPTGDEDDLDGGER